MPSQVRQYSKQIDEQLAVLIRIAHQTPELLSHAR